jgi:hypothetical protein
MAKLTAKQIEEINIGLKNHYTPPPAYNMPVLMSREHYDKMKNAIEFARSFLWECQQLKDQYSLFMIYEDDLVKAIDEVKFV